MKIYQIRRRQELATTLDETWEFFSDPRNLQSITPKYMNFEVKRGFEEERMEPGMIIAYKVSPLLGIKLDWVTEITHVKEKEFFIDEQRFGPYKFWHHKHSFLETANGVMVQDVINYALPLGPLGRVANAFIIRQQLNEIFTYREKALKKRFSIIEPTPERTPSKTSQTKASDRHPPAPPVPGEM